MSAKWVVLGTGGTIAGTAAAGETGYRAGALALEQLVAGVPALAGRPLVLEDVARIDSKDMDWPTWQRLAGRAAHWLAQPDVQGLVVTHGTDTLEETAWFLQRVLAPGRPVVLAGAMRPATDARPDGPGNLVDALGVAQEAIAGVFAVCAGQVHAAADVRKAHPRRLDAFASGDAGPVGRVVQGRFDTLRPIPAPAASPGLLERVLAAAAPPRVEIVHSHAGADGRLVDLLVADGVQGLVVAATGNGTLHQALEAALRRAEAAGVRVVRSTRCVDGVLEAAPAGPLRAVALVPAKARVDLLLDLLP